MISLTVRVERISDTVVDDATPLFERGSTTTYMSFRKSSYVKSWSIRGMTKNHINFHV